MGRPQLYTKNGHSMYDMVSLLQKAIRRGDAEVAGYAANELRGRYNAYLWRRLLAISAEDCYGIMTKEIEALRQADDVYNQKRKGYEREPLFISKAITLLLYARKNRDADYFICNCMQSERVKNFDEYLRIEDCEFSGMPGYAYDCHTLEGKRRGKTVADFIVEEQKDLKPYQPGMFDEESWDRFLGANSRGGWDNTDKKYPQPTEAQLKELESEDFQDGAPVRYEQMDLFGGSKW